MGDLTDFQRGMIVGARLVGASVTTVATIVGVSTGTVSNVTRAYTMHGQTTSAKHNSGRKTILSDRDRRALKLIVAAKKQTTAMKITSELNSGLQNPVSSKTVRRELHKMKIHGRAAIAKPLVTAVNAKRRIQWCKDHKEWTLDQWKHVMYSDESTYTLFPTTGRVYVWRTPSQAYDPDCLRPTVKHGGGSVTVWAVISWFSAGPIIALHGMMNAKAYEAILGDQVLPMAHTLFPDGDGIYQDDLAPCHAAKTVQSWFEEHDQELSHLPWVPQSPDLNIIEPLWSVLERRVRSHYPPPSSLKELEHVLEEEWYNIPHTTIQELYTSIPRRIQAVLDAKGGPTPY
jgi:transposase